MFWCNRMEITDTIHLRIYLAVCTEHRSPIAQDKQTFMKSVHVDVTPTRQPKCPLPTLLASCRKFWTLAYSLYKIGAQPPAVILFFVSNLRKSVQNRIELRHSEFIISMFSHRKIHQKSRSKESNNNLCKQTKITWTISSYKLHACFHWCHVTNAGKGQASLGKKI